MVENKKKAFLCNRWFYLVKETEDKLFYSTNKNQKQVVGKTVNLEIKKETNEMTIIYLQKQKTFGVTSYPIQLHYLQLECENMIVNDNTYTNLLIELSASIDNIYSVPKNGYEICFHKKKKNKELCYQEQNFPMDTKLNTKDFIINSEAVKEFQKLVSTFSRTVTAINQYILHPEKEIPNQIEEESNKEIRNLEIPQELMVYDRVYHLTKTQDSLFIYENNEDGIYNLEIRVDTDNLKFGDIRFKIKKSKGSKGSIQICSNDQNEILTSLSQRDIKEVVLNEEILHKANISSLVIYNNEGTLISNDVNITSQEGNYHLEQHPDLKRFYVDEEGMLYSIGNSEYHEYSSICSFSYGIFHSIEKRLIKKRER